MSIRELHAALQRACASWRKILNSGRGLRAARSESGWPEARAAFRAEAERLRQALPIRTTVAYAYSPRENVGSKGGYHLVVQEPLRDGRLVREAGDALCQPERRFWGLEERPEAADCLRCLEVAERLARVRAGREG